MSNHFFPLTVDNFSADKFLKASLYSCDRKNKEMLFILAIYTIDLLIKI